MSQRLTSERSRGNLEPARAGFAACAESSWPTPDGQSNALQLWIWLASAQIEILVEHAQTETAYACGTAAMDCAAALELGIAAHPIARSLALAEAKLGQHAAAAARLDGVIAQQYALGVRGLHLGVSYEARARVAVWAGDRPATEHFSQLTAAEYRHGTGSALSSRYARLLEDASRVNVSDLPALSDLRSTDQLSTHTWPAPRLRSPGWSRSICVRSARMPSVPRAHCACCARRRAATPVPCICGLAPHSCAQRAWASFQISSMTRPSCNWNGWKNRTSPPIEYLEQGRFQRLGIAALSGETARAISAAQLTRLAAAIATELLNAEPLDA